MSIMEEEEVFMEYSFRYVIGCTNNLENLLHKGDSGPLYKGMIGERIFSPSKYVVVKYFNEDHLNGHDAFLAELEIIKNISHPHIIKIKGSCLTVDRHILLYHYMPGASSLKYHLEKRRGGRTLDWVARVSIMGQVAQALAYLHDNNIAYRDLKPSSILMDSVDHVMLADFGFVTDNTTEDVKKNVNRIIGTPGYVDPASFETGHLSIVTDVYSFGIILFEMITGILCSDLKETEALMTLVHDHSSNKKNLVNELDENIKDAPTDSVYTIAQIAYACVASQPDRITMTDASYYLREAWLLCR